jgi:hypothetical protein
LLDFCTPFRDLWAELELNPSIASILDIVRSLTISTLSLSQRDPLSGTNMKVQSESWQIQTISAYSAVLSLPEKKSVDDSSELDLIYDVCRMAALAYTFAIMSRTKLSGGYFGNARWLQEFHSKLWSVSLTKWQKIPGIFAWILLVCLPSARDTQMGIYAKMKSSATMLHMSIQDFDIAVGILRSFWMVQRWIAGREKVGDEGKSRNDWLKYGLAGPKVSDE